MKKEIGSSAECNPMKPEFWRQHARRICKKHPGKGFLKGMCWDKAAATYDDLESCEDYMYQVNTVLKVLRERGALSTHATILDVSCGTGTYAIRMAPYCKQIVALDISKGMLICLGEKAKRLGLKNIKTLHMDWAEYKSDQSFDLVFASMTPVLRDIDNIDRFLDISKRFVAIVSWAGIRDNPILSELYQQIHGRKPGPHRMDITILFNYLYCLGYAPDLMFFHGCWERKRTLEGQVEGLIWQLEMERPLNEDEKALVREKVIEMAKVSSSDNLLSIYTKVRIGFMLVDKLAGKRPCPPR